MMSEFGYYLVAKEFGIPLQQVYDMPIRQRLKYQMFVEEFYKMMAGEKSEETQSGVNKHMFQFR